MKYLLLLTIFGSATTFGAEIEYRSVTPTKGNYKSFRDAWDKTGQFCYLGEESKETCLRISDLGEVKVRENGKAPTDERNASYIRGLTPDSVKALAELDASGVKNLFVRYMSVDDHGGFAVHIFKDKQTLFAFGRIEGGVATLQSFSHSSRVELDMEALMLMLVASAKNPESVKHFKDIKDEKLLNQAMLALALPQITASKQPLLKLAEDVVNSHINR